jgi:Amt family ammonium transporter
VIWLIIKGTMGLRVDQETEINGLDMAEMGMEAYPEFSKS